MFKNIKSKKNGKWFTKISGATERMVTGYASLHSINKQKELTGKCII